MRPGLCRCSECHPLMHSTWCVWPHRARLLTTWQEATSISTARSLALSLVLLPTPGTSACPTFPSAKGGPAGWQSPVEMPGQCHTCGVFWFSLQMRTSASAHTFVEEPPVTTRWAATSACAPRASSTNSSAEGAKTSTNVALRRRPAATAAPTRRAATCAAVRPVTSG